MADLLAVPPFARLTDYVGVWAIEPAAASALWSAAARLDLAAHVAGGPPRLRSDAQLLPAGGGQQVAVVRLNGTLMKGQSSLGASTSTVQARRDLRKAAADPDVSAILLAVDSPGGTVAGTDDLAAEVRAAAKRKPVWAHVDDLCASAAYWVASQADKVFANSDTALVGSIGTLLTLADSSAAAARDGVQVLVFGTGPLKGAGTPGAPVTDEQRAYFQRMVEASQGSFDRAVRLARGLTDAQLAAARTGGVFPAAEAADRKLIDGVRSFDRTFAALAAEARGRARTPKPTTPAAAAAPTRSRAMDFEQYAAAKGFDDLSALSAAQTAFLRSMFEQEQKGPARPAEAPADPFAGDRAAAAAELRRVAAIKQACAKHPAIAADAIEQNWSAEKAELAAMKADLAASPVRTAGPHAGGGGAADPAADVVEASMLLSLGLKPAAVADQYPAADRERVMNQASARENRGYSLHALMDATIRRAGRSFHGSRKTDGFARAAVDADRELRAGGGFSTVSLSGVLAGLANKVMLARYSAQETVWDRFCAVRSHSDFKAVTRYRMDSTGAFKKVGPDGELKHVGLQDTSFSNKVDTYGAIIALTRQMQINDDLGAFAEVPGMLGDMAAIRVEEAVFVLLLSNAGSFFASGNKNLLSGAGSAFSEAAVTAAEALFRNQVSSNGKPILTRPAVMLVPTTLEVPARKLHAGQTVIAIGQGNAAATVTDNNPHAGKYPPVVSPYLNNTAIRDQDGKAITGQSDTGWYLFADPAVRAAIGVAFLNGQRLPTIDSSETEFQTLGMQWRGYLDFGVGFEDPTAAEKNAGA